MIGWGAARRRERQARRRERDEAEDAARRRFWQDVEDETIEELSHRRRPLNELFEHGSTIRIDSILEYVAALERRVDRLELGADLSDEMAARRR